MTPELLNLEKITQHLPEKLKHLCEKIFIADVLNSTNTYLLEQTRAGNYSYHICLAESQTGGRGRFERHWHSPFGRNIYFSFLQPLSADFKESYAISLIVAIAVMRALMAYGVNEKDIGIKWPNDILSHGAKLAGVLCEVQKNSANAMDVVIGIGLNVDMPEDIKQNIDRPITDLMALTQASQDRNRLTALLIQHLHEALAKFLEKGFAPFYAEWQRYDILKNQTVSVALGSKKITGIVTGINPRNGCLCVLDEEHVQHEFIAGEVSLFQLINN